MKRRSRHSPAVLLALLVGFATTASLAAEIDSWTDRYESRPDVAEELDRLIGERLRAGVEAANQSSSEGCETDRLYRSVKRELGGMPILVGHAITEWLDSEAELASRAVELEDSVYEDLAPLDGPSVHIKGLSGTIIVDDHVIGVDKLGHFFAEGWGYFERAHLESKGIEAAMDWGQASERGRFGYLTTGIYSRADLVANFNGMRFWMRLADAAPDPLGEQALAQPYAVCDAGTWVLQRDFVLGDYLDGVWDEGTNCPLMGRADFRDSVDEHVEAFEAWWSPRRYRCPIRPHDCELARERYGERSSRLLARACLEGEEGAADLFRRYLGLN